MGISRFTEIIPTDGPDWYQEDNIGFLIDARLIKLASVSHSECFFSMANYRSLSGKIEEEGHGGGVQGGANKGGVAQGAGAGGAQPPKNRRRSPRQPLKRIRDMNKWDKDKGIYV